MSARLLIVTAVAAEAEAVLGTRSAAVGDVAGLPVHRVATPAGLLDVVPGGVGAVEAALSTAALLASARYDAVLSAGIGGGFSPAVPADVVVAEQIAFADLGAELADGGFTPVSELGMGGTAPPCDAVLVAAIGGRTGARRGTVLTVATVTGTAARADRLRAAHPRAVAEAMEGFGVARAAQRAGVPFAEVRAISNPVGPRDRAAWQLRPALAALTRACDALLSRPLIERPAL